MKWYEACCFLVIFFLQRVTLIPVTQCVRDKGCTLEDLSPGRLNNKDLENGRLPESLSPYHQVIEMQPDIYRPLPPFPLSGHVDIFFNCLEATDVIYINSVGLTLNESSLEILVAPESPVQPDPPNWLSFELDEDMQFLIVYLDEMMVEGAQYQLSLDYSSTVGNPGFHTSVGLYWDWYEKDDQVRYLVASQFQTSFARYAFPCFDEPAFKATFDVRLSYRDGMKPLSNMPVYMTVGDSEGWLTDYFETTPVMSTYLLAFVVSDFQYVETVTSSGTTVRIWAREDVIHAAEFASSIAGPMQEWYEDYTGIAYPLPKQDHIAIPHKGGAMENWGLITYGEYILLWDPDWSTTSGKFSAADVIAHELAHQWFGNLVTCAWWSESWLNEGFATFFEFPPLQDVLGWSGRELQLAESAHVIMKSDTSNQSSAVYYEVTVPWEGGRAFSSYTYNKGGAILRMLVQVLGEATFQRGINRYLSRHAYSSAVTDDFWTALAEQAAEDGVTDTDGSPLDIKDKFDPWIYQKGHPLITLSPDTELEVLVTQKYFLNPPDQEANDPSPWQYQWNIPITFHTGEEPDWNTNTRVWLDRADGIIDEDLPSDPSEWLVANIGHSGFYRVQYDDGTQQAIVQQLLQDHLVIQEGSRAQLLYDTFTLARAKYHDETTGMELTRYLSAERQYVPWLTADKALIYVSLMLSRYPQSFSKFESYTRALVDPVYLDVGWVPGEDDTYELLSLRNRILWLACSYGNEECVDECRRQWGLWQDDTENNPTATDHRFTVYCSSVRSGDATDWEFAHSRYLVAADNRHPYIRSEIESLLNSMACTEDTTLLQQYLQYTFDPELIHPEDATRAVTALAVSDYGGREVMWEHLQDNWRNDPVPDGVNKHNVLLSVVEGFATDADLEDLVNFIDQYPAEDEDEDDIYITALQTVQTNNDWASANQEQLDDWLTEYAPTDHVHNTWRFGKFASHGMYQKILDSLTANLHK